MFEYNLCHRSPNAYSQNTSYSALGYANLKANAFHACSGAITSNVWQWGQGYIAPDNIPQLNHSDTQSANMVTLTIGGNDAMFTDIIHKCFSIFNSDCRVTPYGNSGRTWKKFTRDQIAIDVRSWVHETLRRVCSASPGATIYVLGYPKLFPKEGVTPACTNNFFNSSQQTVREQLVDEQLWLNKIADELNDMLSQEAGASGAYFVDMYRRTDDSRIEDNGYSRRMRSAGQAPRTSTRQNL